MKNGYNFYFNTPYGLVIFPITPGALNIKVGSNNTTVTLINEGDINVLKSPALTEVSFEARFPMRRYPYVHTGDFGFKEFQKYHDVFKKLVAEKQSLRFVVARSTPNGKRTWDTNLQMALESYDIDESADEGDDVLISFKLKQYKPYGVKKIKVSTTINKPTTTSTSNKNRDNNGKANSQKTYTVKRGDCLWNISKKFYNKGSEWKKIYNANKSAIEADAKKHGRKSSSNGHWIYPGLKLVIPPK